MDKHDLILAECKRRGLTVERVGAGWRICGRGVDIRVLRYQEGSARPSFDGARDGTRTRKP